MLACWLVCVACLPVCWLAGDSWVGCVRFSSYPSLVSCSRVTLRARLASRARACKCNHQKTACFLLHRAVTLEPRRLELKVPVVQCGAALLTARYSAQEKTPPKSVAEIQAVSGPAHTNSRAREQENIAMGAITAYYIH